MRWPTCPEISVSMGSDSRLHGRLHCGIGKVMVVQCHRLGDDSDGDEAQAMAWAMRRARLPLLQLDFAGHGRSQGQLRLTTYSSMMADLQAALRYLQGRQAQHFVLFGAGLGGSAALLAAARDERIVAVATLAAVGRPAEHAVPPDGQALQWPLGIAESAFVRDAMQHDVTSAARVLQAPVLVIHGDADPWVPLGEAEDLAASPRHASMEVLLGAGHSFERPTERRAAMLRAAAFLEDAALAAMINK